MSTHLLISWMFAINIAAFVAHTVWSARLADAAKKAEARDGALMAREVALDSRWLCINSARMKFQRVLAGTIFNLRRVDDPRQRDYPVTWEEFLCLGAHLEIKIDPYCADRLMRSAGLPSGTYTAVGDGSYFSFEPEHVQALRDDMAKTAPAGVTSDADMGEACE